MKHTLIFDTETSGVTSKTLAADHPDQGHVMQLAALLVDELGTEKASFYTLVYPEVNYIVNPGAFAAHGIERNKCEAIGLPLKAVLAVFSELYEIADTVVAHNLKFDKGIIDTAIALTSWSHNWNATKHFCTMEAMTPICRLPAKWKGTEFKWPKLEEAYRHCFKTEMTKAHDALGDVRATSQVYLWLQSQKAKQP